VPAASATAFEATAEPVTEWHDYVLIYPYVQKNIQGYYSMSYEWSRKTDTNMTVGLLGLFLAFGGVFGYLAPKSIFRKLPPKRRQLATMIATAILTMAFCYYLSLVGVPGFRFG
jgi:hypothetical protein